MARSMIGASKPFLPYSPRMSGVRSHIFHRRMSSMAMSASSPWAIIASRHFCTGSWFSVGRQPWYMRTVRTTASRTGSGLRPSLNTASAFCQPSRGRRWM